jgi:hypothetical protein
MHRNTVSKVLRRFQRGEELESKRKKVWRRALSPGDLEALRQILDCDETLYLDELAMQLALLTGKRRVSKSVICRGLQDLGLTRKKARAVGGSRVRAAPLPAQPCLAAGVLRAPHARAPRRRRRSQLHSIARERCELKRANFVLRCLNEFRWDQFVWTDESAVVRGRPRLCLAAVCCARAVALACARARAAALLTPLTLNIMLFVLSARARTQDGRTHQREFGRAYRGRRTRTRTLFLRGQRFSVVPVMSADGLLDWYIAKGSINKER